jgi:hypothetical protein
MPRTSADRYQPRMSSAVNSLACGRSTGIRWES